MYTPKCGQGAGAPKYQTFLDVLHGWSQGVTGKYCGHYVTWNVFTGDMAEDEADIEVAAVAKKSPVASSSPLKTLKLVLGNETVSTIKLQQD